MNKYIIVYNTNTNRVGFAIVYASNPNTALTILLQQGAYKTEGYKITSIEEDKYICTPNTIVAEGASQIINFQEISIPEVDDLLPYKTRNRVTDFLYTIIPSKQPDYEYAKNYFYSHKVNYNGGCSSFKKGNFYARNYDWHYNNTVEFVITTPAYKNKHKVLGIASFDNITRDNINDFSLYKILPFYLEDGINDAGLCCSINVVPANETGWIPTTGTTPDIKVKEIICMRMLPRYILDNFSTALEAKNYIKNYISVYASNNLYQVGYELHVMIADSSSCYIMEFINNEIKIVEGNISTNFRLYNSEVKDDKTIDIDTVSPFSSGIERFNKISTSVDNLLENEQTLLTFMSQDLKYTNAYDSNTNPKWYTEFVGKYEDFDITAQDAATNEHITSVMNTAIQLYQNRLRSTGLTWHTAHTSLYNMLNKTLTLVSLENNNNVYRYSL